MLEKLSVTREIGQECREAFTKKRSRLSRGMHAGKASGCGAGGLTASQFACEASAAVDAEQVALVTGKGAGEMATIGARGLRRRADNLSISVALLLASGFYRRLQSMGQHLLFFSDHHIRGYRQNHVYVVGGMSRKRLERSRDGGSDGMATIAALVIIQLGIDVDIVDVGHVSLLSSLAFPL
ncbi:hypothetical protein ACLOJK_027482 [Asimina triloba]